MDGGVLPEWPILKKLAPLYKIPLTGTNEILRGIWTKAAAGPSDDEEVNRAFDYVMSDSQIQNLVPLSGELTIDVKTLHRGDVRKATG